MKKMNSYIPLWFLLIVPPLVVFLLIFNLTMSAVGILVTAIFLKVGNPFDEYYKNSLKVFMISILPTIFISASFMAPQILRKNEFIYNNFIYHLEYNPYKNIFSTLYIILILIISFYITYKKVSKKITKHIETDETTRIQASIILTLFIIPYILFLPSTMFLKPNKSNLDDFYGTVMQDNKTIDELFKQLATTKHINSYFLETKREPYTIHIYLDKIDNYRLYFEMDASMIFYLVKDVNEITFHMGKESYTYKINDINNVFGNIDKLELNDINNRFTTKQMQNYTYLGRMGEYDIFDKSKDKEKKTSLIHSEDDINYFVECNDIDNVIAYKDYKEVPLIELLKSNKADANDLLQSQLEIIIVGENENENID